jgi:hypothetical protein
MEIARGNVGKIAERIVMNELEARGYRVTDLNKDGLSANADLLAAKDGRVWQLQVKGASNKEDEHWWIHYGYCTDDMIHGRSPVFNRRTGFYTAQYVVLAAVKAPSNYRCFVVPVREAEILAQINLSRYYREPKKSDGSPRKAGKMWVQVEASPRERRTDQRLFDERKKLIKWEANWDLVG